MNENQPTKRRSMLSILFIVLLSVLVLAAVILVVTVDDWSRDLTQNTAETDAEAADSRLHPLVVELESAASAETVEHVAAGLAHWVAGDREELDDSIVLRFVRTTPLMRFKDDITVTIIPLGDGRCRIEAESRSRVGRGDLGQNPRNVDELLSALEGEPGFARTGDAATQ